MKNITPKYSNKNESTGLIHVVEYEEFIAWLALPKSLKIPKTQAELANKLGVGPDTLSDWKLRDGFWDKVNDKMRSWAKEKTPDVIGILYDKIIKTGGASEIRIWLEWQKEINPSDGYSKDVDQLRQTIKRMIDSTRKKSTGDSS